MREKKDRKSLLVCAKEREKRRKRENMDGRQSERVCGRLCAWVREGKREKERKTKWTPERKTPNRHMNKGTFRE